MDSPSQPVNNHHVHSHTTAESKSWLCAFINILTLWSGSINPVSSSISWNQMFLLFMLHYMKVILINWFYTSDQYSPSADTVLMFVIKAFLMRLIVFICLTLSSSEVCERRGRSVRWCWQEVCVCGDSVCCRLCNREEVQRSDAPHHRTRSREEVQVWSSSVHTHVRRLQGEHTR